jgi:hypothetical protein
MSVRAGTDQLLTKSKDLHENGETPERKSVNLEEPVANISRLRLPGHHR